ncbi:MAG: hypothetical protein RJA83_244 [Pseudomonadota bacterium]|jgi:hypothetical protein
MKYRFLKLSIFSFTTYFLAVPVNADLVELSSNDVSTDRIEQLTRTLAQGSYAESNDIDLPAALSTIHSLKRQTFYDIYCRKKEFDNTKICYLKANDIYVFLINGRYSVDVGSNHYPRSKAGLRIDNSPAVYGYEGEFSKPLSIIEKLKKGKFAYTRYQEWPYLSDLDNKTDLKDFTKQFNEMIKQYKNL